MAWYKNKRGTLRGSRDENFKLGKNIIRIGVIGCVGFISNGMRYHISRYGGRGLHIWQEPEKMPKL